LNKESGLLGVSGISSDMRDIIEHAENGNERAQLAIDIFCKRVAEMIGAYLIKLGGLDAIAFTAGIGENSSYIRSKIMDLLKPIGVIYDKNQNSRRGEELLLSTSESSVSVFLVPTNEELVIARDSYKFVKTKTCLT
jgi:acetate kinase